MQHKISDLVGVVTAMYQKSTELYIEKYNKAKEERSEAKIDFLVADIQAMARQIAADTAPYKSLTGKEETE